VVAGWNCVKRWADIRPEFVAAFPGLANIFDPGAAAEQQEPHVHWAIVQPGTGTAYVTDEGEHCFLSVRDRAATQRGTLTETTAPLITPLPWLGRACS